MSDPRTDLSAATAFDGSWSADGWPTALPPSADPSAALGTDSQNQLSLTPPVDSAAAAQVPTLSSPATDDQALPLSEAAAAEIIGEWDCTTSVVTEAVVDSADGADNATGEAIDVAEPFDAPALDGVNDVGADESAVDAVAGPMATIAAAAEVDPVSAGNDLSVPDGASGEVAPGEADWFPSADAPPVVPLYFVGFCLGCDYNLRGLGAARCPECGRIFRPTDPTSYSTAPGGGPGKVQPRPKPWPRPSAGAAAGTFPWSAGTTVDRVAWLERRVRQLALRNGELEGMVRALIDVMVARGMLTADDLFEIVPAEPAMDADESAAEVAEALTQVTDDTPLNAEADVESAALRELQRAVRQRRRV